MRFRDEYYFLSNMYPAPVTVKLNGQVLTFKCSEAAFQACKCPAMADKFLGIDGFAAKRLGKKVPLRADWDDVKLSAMGMIVKAKFAQNPELMTRLLNTGNTPLVEENTWNDTYWGVYNGKGQNHLGQTLMALRAGLL